MTTAIYLPTERAKTLNRFINAHRLWHRKCEDLSAAERLEGRGGVRFLEALAAWEKGRMPSKRSKYHAYDDSRALARYIGEVTGVEPERASTVDEMAAILAEFKALVG